MKGPENDISLVLKGALGSFSIDVDFNLPMTGITALYGPSGSGKTTILRCLAGLERLPGRLRVGSEVWQDSERGVFVPPHRRRVGYVFQEASLFPHLSVRDNLLYGARRVEATASQRAPDFDVMIGLLGIRHLLERSTTTLSGGERQRVAVGRALLSAPKLLLMDEPLSALDKLTRDEILPYFEMLHEKSSVPILYVSHDIGEIERLADTLALMRNGRLVASGPLRQLLVNPSLPFLGATDASVVLDGRISAIDDIFALSEVMVAGGTLVVAGRHGEVGDNRRLRIAASDVSLAKTAAVDSTILNCLPAQIISIHSREGEAYATVLVALGADGKGNYLAARITRRSLVGLALAAGDAVYVQIKGVSLVASRTATDA